MALHVSHSCPLHGGDDARPVSIAGLWKCFDLDTLFMFDKYHLVSHLIQMYTISVTRPIGVFNVFANELLPKIEVEKEEQEA